jgi:hypothetical protein
MRESRISGGGLREAYLGGEHELLFALFGEVPGPISPGYSRFPPLALRKTCPNSSRSIILDFWQVVVGSKPEELAPQTSHRAWRPEEPCR